MSDIKSIRSGLGLSQNQMACLLGISEGLLSMAESGKRKLPSEAVQILGQWAILAVNQTTEIPESEKIPILQVLTEKEANWKKEKRAEWNTLCLDLEKKEKELKTIKERWLWAINPGIQNLYPSDSTEKMELDLILRKTKKKFLDLAWEVKILKMKQETLKWMIENSLAEIF
jgi:transcriptional regulator with XRE-family HTH domain